MSSSTTCYCLNGDVVEECGADPFPCGNASPGFFNSETGVQLCCAGADTCGANSICKWGPGDMHSAGGSGYYLGGCTDKTFKDTLCRSDCNSRAQLGTSDIVYQQQLGVWSCCGKGSSGEVNCSDPITDFSFETDWTPSEFPGPVNQVLTPAITTTRASTTTVRMTSTTTASKQTTTSISTTPVPTASAAAIAPGTTDSLSTGAKIGIGVGVALGALTIIGLIVAVIVVFKRTRHLQTRRNSATPSTQIAQPGMISGLHDQSSPMSRSEYGVHEADITRVQEMDMGKPIAELDHLRRQPHELANTAIAHELGSTPR